MHWQLQVVSVSRVRATFPVEPMRELAWGVLFAGGDPSGSYVALFIIVDVDEDSSLDRL